MAFSEPLSLGGSGIVYPGGPPPMQGPVPPGPLNDAFGSPIVYPGFPNIQMGGSPLPGGIPGDNYGPGTGLFEGPTDRGLHGGSESITGMLSGPSVPGGPASAPGAPSAPGATNTGVSNPGMLGLTPENAMTDVTANTIGAQIGAQIGAPPGLSNAVVSGIGMATGIPGIGLANTISGLFGDLNDPNSPTNPSAAPVTPEEVTGVNDAGQSSPTGPTGPTAGPTGPGSSSSGVPGAVDNAAAGGDAGTSGSDTVICTELHRQGYMDEETWEKDQAFGQSVPPDVRAGYLLWALPIVRLMRRSPGFSRLVWAVAKPWADHMAGRENLTGRIIMRVGWRICAVLGRRRLVERPI